MSDPKSRPSKTHVVVQGETLSRIAADNGFGNVHTLSDHPKNSALMKKRPNHSQLVPDDEVFVPAFEPRVESADTKKRTVFKATLPVLFLRIRPHDLNNEPVKSDVDCLLEIGEAEDKTPIKTDDKGILEKIISPKLEKAELHIEIKKMKLDVLVGHLDALDTLSGQRARLNNLGYFAGFTEKDRKQFRWGAEEFKKDRGVTPIAVKEEDIDEVEGIKAPAFRTKLEKEHGC
jgi:hypothetical protein